MQGNFDSKRDMPQAKFNLPLVSEAFEPKMLQPPSAKLPETTSLKFRPLHSSR